ncbi:MAG: glycosyltransferase family 39 protein, partial [Bacteroidota bacterium]
MPWQHEPWWFLLGLVLLIGIRFFYLGPEIDDPHSWRQCDTAHYAWDFYQNGIDLMEPSVCWMGGHETVIFEFPLPEAVMAVLYKIFGPHLVVARLFILLCFLVGLRYFFLVLRMLVNGTHARMATLFYLLSPLGVFYSRAIHVDFFALMLVHGMLYHYMVGIRRSALQHILIGSGAATVGLMVKAPYFLPLAFPLMGWVLRHGKFRFCLRNLHWFLLPVGIFWLWQSHVYAVNGAAPDWDFIPTYRKFDDNSHWYFGNMEMRKVWVNWLILKARFQYEVMGGMFWMVLCLVGLGLSWQRFGHNFMRLWVLGTLVYVAVFFNVNVIHDYYQLPLLAPAAFFLAYPAIWVHDRLKMVVGKWAQTVLVAVLVLAGANTYRLL